MKDFELSKTQQKADNLIMQSGGSWVRATICRDNRQLQYSSENFGNAAQLLIRKTVKLFRVNGY